MVMLDQGCSPAQPSLSSLLLPHRFCRKRSRVLRRIKRRLEVVVTEDESQSRRQHKLDPMSSPFLGDGPVVPRRSSS